MLTAMKQLIKERCESIRNNKERLNDLIAEEYDSQDHDKPFDVIEMNRIKQFILKRKLRKIVVQDLRDEGIIPHQYREVS